MRNSSSITSKYNRRSYELAETLYRRSPLFAGKIVALSLGRHTARKTRVDEFALEWMVRKHQVLHAGVMLYRKFTRHVPGFHSGPRVIEQTEAAYEAESARIRRKETRTLGEECGRCSLRRICDRDTPAFRRAFPNLPIHAQEGELVANPHHYTEHQPKYYDEFDEKRRGFSEYQEQLAEKARRIVNTIPPDKRFGFGHFRAINTFYVQLPGAIRWFSITNGEKLSTVLDWPEAPYTISMTFGGGLADQIGFSIGRHIKIVCPMESYTHQLTLHVDANGRYVLLRDGVLVRPTEFEGEAVVPTTLPTVAPIQLSIWNIDHNIYTQNLLIWEGEKPRPKAENVQFSVVIVSMRFTRRLQAVLRALGHQTGVEPGSIEVIVAYAPGIDATDDLLTSVEQAFPHLRIVRSPFTERYVNAKGFVINESAKLAKGDWVMILDSDIILPPDLFARIAQLPDDCRWTAPDRRKMLTPDTTAKILLGEINPWDSWEELLGTEGEIRVKEGTVLPIGFCQCVRRACLEKVSYTEYEHFEGADWDFIAAIQEQCGDGQFLDDLPVLHLDHGGSQWYGTRRHL